MITYFLLSITTDSQVGHPLTLGKTAASFGSHYGIDRNLLPIPTYQIGLYLMKASSHLSQSILARYSWQFWQRGFSTCSILPFSFQRVLPPDAVCLQSDDDHSADDHKSNRPAFYFQSPDGILVCCICSHCSLFDWLYFAAQYYFFRWQIFFLVETSVKPNLFKSWLCDSCQNSFLVMWNSSCVSFLWFFFPLLILGSLTWKLWYYIFLFGKIELSACLL